MSQVLGAELAETEENRRGSEREEAPGLRGCSALECHQHVVTQLHKESLREGR